MNRIALIHYMGIFEVMSYLTVLIVCFLVLFYVIRRIIIYKDNLIAEWDAISLGLIFLFVGIYFSLDLPQFIYGGIDSNVKFINISGGERKSLICTFEDDSYKNYWAGMAVDSSWVYHMKNVEAERNRIYHIKYLPNTKFIMEITEDSNFILYYHWWDIGTAILIGFIGLIILAFKDIMCGAFKT